MFFVSTKGLSKIIQAGMVCYNYPKLLSCLKKTLKVIVEPEKTEQNKPDRQMFIR